MSHDNTPANDQAPIPPEPQDIWVGENTQIRLSLDAQRRLYVATLVADGTLVSMCAYQDSGAKRLFIHTETADTFTGKEVAEKLVRYALNATVAEEKTIVPACSYMANFVHKHRDWSEHVIP